MVLRIWLSATASTSGPAAHRLGGRADGDGGASLERLLHVVADDAAAGAGAVDRGDVEIVLGGDARGRWG